MLRTTSTIIQRTAETVHFHSNPPSSCQSRLTGIQHNGTHSIPGTVVRVDNDDHAIYPATFPRAPVLCVGKERCTSICPWGYLERQLLVFHLYLVDWYLCAGRHEKSTPSVGRPVIQRSTTMAHDGSDGDHIEKRGRVESRK